MHIPTSIEQEIGRWRAWPHASRQAATPQAVDLPEPAAAGLAEHRRRFVAAVEAELCTWDACLERLQVKAATTAGSAREQAEAAISELRRHRSTLNERLGALRSASAEAWGERRNSVAEARDELGRRAAEVEASLGRGPA